MENYDVVVAGGGSAGLAAAVTAAREGARTLLVERCGYLGGMGTASLVHTFCGLYLLRDEPDAVLANPGFASEMAERMIAATGIGPQRMGRVDVLLQHPVEFVRIADELVAAESDLELRLHTELLGARWDGEGWELELGTRGSLRQVRAAVLVDASGDAVVAGLLGRGATMTESPRLQRPAYVFGMHGPREFGDGLRLRTAGLLVAGVREGQLDVAALGLSFRASGRTGEIFGSLDLAADDRGYDPLDAGCLTRLELEGRAVAAAAVRWLCASDEEWKGAYVSHWPARAGIRESRRWIGEYVLRGDEILGGARFDDEIGLATWPLEFRETARGPKLRYPEGNRPTGIPLRCLKPAGMERLFVAGRCISTDHDAQASVRVMGTCFVTGEAAGRVACGWQPQTEAGGGERI